MGSGNSARKKDTPDKPDIFKSKNGAVVGIKTGARGSRDTAKFPQKRKSSQPKVNAWDHLQILPLRSYHRRV